MENTEDDIEVKACAAPVCSAVPVAYRLPWSRYENPAPWNAVEVQATMFEEGRPTQWAIREGGCVLTKKREWEMEPMPSSRTDKFLKRSRWKTWEAAVAFAMEFHSQNVRCGGTAAQDSKSEANEGAYPPLPPTTCSAFRIR